MTGKLEFPDDVCKIDHPKELRAIRLLDYNKGDSYSPEHSLRGLSVQSPSDTASVHSYKDPTSVLLMLEDLSCFIGLEVYDCHMMSRKDFPEEEKNENNILKLSWALHQRFDGLKTSGPHNHPQIAVSFVCNEGSVDVEAKPGLILTRDKVLVSIEICSTFSQTGKFSRRGVEFLF
jgi:hypothetical protein